MTSTTRTHTRIATTIATALLGTLAASASHAATIAALQDGNTIAWIDTDAKKVTGSVALAGGASIVGFDVRPADGKLYGLTAEGAIVVIDAKTGKWEQKSQLSEKLPAGASFSVDFNPVADRMRILTSTGISLRVNVEDMTGQGISAFGDALSMTALPLLVLTVILLRAEHMILGRRGYAVLGGKNSDPRIVPLGIWRWPALLMCLFGGPLMAAG